MNLKEQALAIQLWRQSQGFYTPHGISTDQQKEAMLAKLMLVVTEVSEMAEAVRNEDEQNFREELADALIRLLDIASSCNIDFESEVEIKMEINKKRPRLNGKKCRL